ncbi:class I SAM-dependent DNA methyltransferase [Bradyrhizobium diazoefficiens]
MNAVEIEEAISALAEESFDAAEFPYLFLQAFGNKETTLKRLRKGESNRSDLGGVLQTNNIHIAVAAPGKVTNALAALKASPETTRAKAKFVLATDGDTFEAEDLASGETVACAYADFPDHFGFFLPLAGITTVKQVRESSFDIRATSRLNRLYVELLKTNPEWGTAERRPDMNHFMARLIFCFFAEDTDIFGGSRRFTSTVEQMSAKDSSNTNEVIGTLFRAMNMKGEARATAGIPRWADQFPYVNGGLFSGSMDVPRFSKIARSYLLHIGHLDWTKINPDIFGSMIQAVAEDGERGALGMHYTSVPNILKILNPLFLDDLRARLDDATDNPRKLLNLRNRLARIRVFDPACGSGNFLVIAYKEMRAIEAEINRRRGESDRRSDIPLTNFRGIEIRDFPAEVARLALIIAEYQCDVLYRGQKEALQDFLPLDAENWITCGNALRLDWLSLMDVKGTGVKHRTDDLFHTPLDQAQVDFENEGGEVYICGNPPYVGDKFQTDAQKADLRLLSNGGPKAVDYVAGWFWKASDFIRSGGSFAFVATNSICQGVQVPLIWSPILRSGQQIIFAHKDFYWANNASNNANVICVIVGVSSEPKGEKFIYFDSNKKLAKSISAYLIDGPSVIVEKHPTPISNLPEMVAGNISRDKGHFMMRLDDRDAMVEQHPEAAPLFRKILGSFELINGVERTCLWIDDDQASLAASIPAIAERLEAIRKYRETGSERGKLGIATPHRFERTITGKSSQIVVPRVFSERRPYVTADYMKSDIIVSDQAQALYDAPLYVLSIISSRMHLAWISVTAGRMKSDYRYSSGVCYNSFPVPRLTEKNVADLAKCAEDILLTREAHFPATIADLYAPEKMPADLREAHERNDEVLERIYIGRRFRNDTERLEKLFELYTKMIAEGGTAKKNAKAGVRA